MNSRDDLPQGPNPPHHALRLGPTGARSSHDDANDEACRRPPDDGEQHGTTPPQQAEVRGRGGLHQRANEVPEPPAAHASMRAAANPALTLIVNAPNNVPIPMIPANASRWTYRMSGGEGKSGRHGVVGLAL